MKLRHLHLLVVCALLFALIAGACGIVPVAQKVSHEHDKLVVLYQNADAARANARACFDMNGGKVRDSFKGYNKFLDSNVEAINAWKAKVNAADAAVAKAEAAAEATANSDLGTAAAQGGTPADIASGFALQIAAYNEAPWIGLSEDMYLSIQDLIEEAYSTNYGCVLDWTENVKAYNIERARINGLVDSGRIVGDAANALGITELPLKLPYYESKSDREQGQDFLDDGTGATPTP